MYSSSRKGKQSVKTSKLATSLSLRNVRPHPVVAKSKETTDQVMLKPSFLFTSANMDATTLTGHVGDLNAANQAGKSDVSDVVGVVSPRCLRRSFVGLLLTSVMMVYRKSSLCSRNFRLRLFLQKIFFEYVYNRMPM